MSLTGLSDPEKICKKSFHRRDDSGELDVFEAAGYFSGANEMAGYNGAISTQKIMIREERQPGKGGRMSLDMRMRDSIPSHNQTMEKPMKEKKYRQPTSPGGKLANFLNLLFNQTSSKKKKSKSNTQSMKDEEESPGGRRKRRSSISHFRSSSGAADSKSMYSSSISGFRTPPPYSYTPIKIYKDLRNYSVQKPVVSLTRNCEAFDGKRSTDYAKLDEKIKLNNGFSEKIKNVGNGIQEKGRIRTDQQPSEERENRKFDIVDDGADSDSSSDLFELQNYDLGYYSSGLPVYETTHMDSIKRGAPISSVAV